MLNLNLEDTAIINIIDMDKIIIVMAPNSGITNVTIISISSVFEGMQLEKKSSSSRNACKRISAQR